MEDINSIKSFIELGSLIISFMFLLWMIRHILTVTSEQISKIKSDIEKILYIIERRDKENESKI